MSGDQTPWHLRDAAPAHGVSFTPIVRFALHFLEMCVVMCVGGYAVSLAVFGAARVFGYPDLVTRVPELAIAVIAAGDALVMAAWMYVRGHGVRHNVEMPGATLLGAVPFVAALWLGLIPDDRLVSWNALFAFTCGPLCVLMLAVIAPFGHYGGHFAVLTIAASTRPKGGYTCSMHPEVDSSAPGRCPVCGMKLVLRST